MMKTLVRDKRYVIPVLAIDLFDAIFTTIAWSASQFAFQLENFPLKREQKITGSFTSTVLTGEPGLFEAEIIQHDGGIYVAKFTWLSPEGKALLTRARLIQTEMRGQIRDGLTAGELPQLSVSLTRHSINWSFSGAVLNYIGGPLTAGQRTRGMIRSYSSADLGFFTAIIVRIDAEADKLAVKFADISNFTFEFLEDALKKRKEPEGDHLSIGRLWRS